MKRAAAKLYQNKFVRNIATLVTGTVITQATTVAITPIVSRLYAPEAFGALGAFNLFISIIGPVAALNYPMAIVLARSETDAKFIGRFSLLISIVLAVLLAIVTTFWRDELVIMLHIEPIAPFLCLLPLVLMGHSVYQLNYYWAVRRKLFRAISLASVTHSFAIGGARVWIGLLEPTAATLVGVASVAQALLAATLMASVRYVNGAARQTAPVDRDAGETPSTIRRLASEYRAFPLYRMPESVLNALTGGLPTILLLQLDGAAAAGCYVLTTQVLLMPVVLIGTGISDVFLARFTEAIRGEGAPAQLLWKATLGVCALAIIPFSIVVAFGPLLFSLFLGKAWILSGQYSQWLAISFFFSLVKFPSVGAVPALGLQKASFLTEIASFSLSSSALVGGLIWFPHSVFPIALYAIVRAAITFAFIAGVIAVARKRYGGTPYDSLTMVST